MADHSHIEWTDATWNPITGCSVVSPGCTNCYAMRLAGGRLKHVASRQGLTIDSKAGPVWNGQVRLNADQLTQPLRWNRPRRIFVCAHGDLFHESVPDDWIDRVFAVMALSPQHTYQILTKRAERMRAYMAERWQGTTAQHIDFADGTSLDVPAGPETGRDHQVEQACEPFLQAFGLADTTKDHLWTDEGSCKAMRWKWPLPNVWLGVSAEDQARGDERIPHLLATPAAVRFVSAEPLLGPIDFEDIAGNGTVLAPECWGDCACDSAYGPDPGCRRNGGDGQLARKVDWVIAGGESGPGARPLHPDWARAIRDQCAAAGVPFFFKQMTKRATIPADLCVREFPDAQ